MACWHAERPGRFTCAAAQNHNTLNPARVQILNGSCVHNDALRSYLIHQVGWKRASTHDQQQSHQKQNCGDRVSSLGATARCRHTIVTA